MKPAFHLFCTTRYFELTIHVNLDFLQIRGGNGTPSSTNPQTYLDNLLKTRGYDALVFRALDTAYYNRPTEFQKASYGPALVHAVRSKDAALLQELLAHLSANPCTSRGESLWHLVCRCGSIELLNMLLQHPYSPKLCQVVNDYGRTVLHDACWAPQPALEVAKALLDRNPILLFLADARGALPLSYISPQHWSLWLNLMDRHVDSWFPKTGSTVKHQRGLDWARRPPHSDLLVEPLAVSLNVATKIASGQVNMILEWASTGSDVASFGSVTKVVQSARAMDHSVSDIDDSHVDYGEYYDADDQVSHVRETEDTNDDIQARRSNDARALLGGASALQMVYQLTASRIV